MEWLASLLVKSGIAAFGDSFFKPYLTHLDNKDAEAGKLAAKEIELQQRESELQAQIITSEEGRWYTALPRPLFAYAIVILIWKLVVWDTVLGLGTTGEIPKFVSDWAGVIITAYFGGRSLEKAARALARK